MSLCKYKNALGTPRKGFHSYRVLDIAVFDVILTLGLAWLVTLLFPKLTFLKACLIMFGLGIIFHKVFCVDTTINRLLNGAFQ